MNYNQMLSLIDQEKPFAFSRWGDGEFLCASGKTGKNIDGVVYEKSLAIELKRILQDPKRLPYCMALQPTSHGLYSDGHKYEQKWTNADILHEASLGGKFGEFYNRLKTRKVIYVGNARHTKLVIANRVNWRMVDVEFATAYQYKTLALRVIENYLKTFYPKEQKVVLFSAGPTSNVLIDWLYAKNPMHQYIDVGSVFDPFLGANTRSYHNRVNLNQISL